MLECVCSSKNFTNCKECWQVFSLDCCQELPPALCKTRLELPNETIGSLEERTPEEHSQVETVSRQECPSFPAIHPPRSAAPGSADGP